MESPSIYRLRVSSDVVGKQQCAQIAEAVGYKAAASSGSLVVLKHFLGYILSFQGYYFVGDSIGGYDLVSQTAVVVEADAEDLTVSHFAALRKS